MNIALPPGRRFLGALACAALCFSACATAEPPGSSGDDPDGGFLGSIDAPPPPFVDAPPDEEADARVIIPVDGPPKDIDAPPTPDAPPPDAAPQPVPITITHSNDPDTVLASNSASCNGDENGDGVVTHADNHYIRVFVLEEFNITSDFTIESVEFGIQTATSGSGTQPLQLRFSTLSGGLSFGNMTRIGTYDLDLADFTEVVFTATLNPPLKVPAGETLVVEIFTPDGEAADNLFFIGSNNAGQTDPSYIAAPVCGNTPIAEPTPASSLGFPDMHIVMSVNGTHIP